VRYETTGGRHVYTFAFPALLTLSVKPLPQLKNVHALHAITRLRHTHTRTRSSCSSASVQGSLLMLGSSWLCHRSRH
jgi:hypothetical protein